jgi:hypothetical protein
LKWFCGEICQHYFGGTMLDGDFVTLDPVFDKKIPNIDMV